MKFTAEDMDKQHAVGYREGAERERERCIRCVPATWLDPLLSGPDKIAEFQDGPAVERLLNAIRARIACKGGEQADAPTGETK